jgi:hypothetical protein
MKTLFITFIIIGIALSACAQTWGEWFNQKSTQKKYLLEQIAALQVYAGYVKKGYGIAKDGLHLIGDIKNGDFNLHDDYFNSLKNVNPVIKKYPRVADIISIQDGIIKLVRKARKELPLMEAFGTEELGYINRVYDRLIKDCNSTLDDLEIVTTSGKVEMKDDERINRIDTLYDQASAQYAFAKGFTQEAVALAKRKSGEQKEIRDSRVINGIK